MTTTVRLGTRRSPLALAQSSTVAEALRAAGLGVELVEVTTVGDSSPAALTAIGGTGVFVSALRDALLDGRCDLAVHSLKDLPTQPDPRLRVAAVPPREDPRDVLCAAAGWTLAGLLPGARVGTGSPRRAAQLRALRRGLDVVAVRGNVGTRLGLVERGELDAVVLARAGLARLGRLDAVTEVLDLDTVLPAPGQGALAVETRYDVAATLPVLAGALARLDDAPSRAAVTAERALLAALEAGCTAPVGALAVLDDAAPGGSSLWLHAVVAALDGAAVLRRSASGPAADPVGLGRRLAASMLAAGAARLVDLPLPAPSPPAHRGRVNEEIAQ
jgi:hydroxymethylbilane synthase